MSLHKKNKSLPEIENPFENNQGSNYSDHHPDTLYEFK